VALRLSACLDDAADVVQEVFLAAWERRARFGGRAAFRTWLIAIAVRKCANRVRVVKPLSLDAPETPTPTAPANAAPDRRAIERERDDALYAAILALPRAQCQAVVLHYIEGMTCAETAAAMGISPGTVMTHLFRARASLRANLRWLGCEEGLP
jgi:RNA polymerase sigma-70 factor (ECF subfamily)